MTPDATTIALAPFLGAANTVTITRDADGKPAVRSNPSKIQGGTMNHDKIKWAAAKLYDADRLREMLSALQRGEPVVVHIGHVNLNIASGEAVRATLIDYVKIAIADVERDLVKITGVRPNDDVIWPDGEDDDISGFDRGLAALDADAFNGTGKLQ